MTRFTRAALLALAALGCRGGDAVAPARSDFTPVSAASADRSPDGAYNHVIPYEKWITAYPAMAGNADGIRGAFTGTILQRAVSADGKIIHLRAEYVVTDTHRKGHSFTAVIEGDESLWTNTAVLIGVVTDGWKKGSPVLVNFDVLSPCTVPTAPGTVKTCFRGTIRIGHGGDGEEDDDGER
jgi:hypothetical protein